MYLWSSRKTGVVGGEGELGLSWMCLTCVYLWLSRKTGVVGGEGELGLSWMLFNLCVSVVI